MRTTSAVEAYNGVLGRIVQRNLNFFKFVKAIKSEEFSKGKDFQLLVNSGGAMGSNKICKLKWANRNKKIAEASLQLLNGKITANVFLYRMVFPSNEICIEMEPDEDLFEEYKGTDEQDEELLCEGPQPSGSNDNGDIIMCIICLSLPPSVLFLPCKHIKLCGDCFSKLKVKAGTNNTVKCPLCRSIINDSIENIFI